MIKLILTNIPFHDYTKEEEKQVYANITGIYNDHINRTEIINSIIQVYDYDAPSTYDKFHMRILDGNGNIAMLTMSFTIDFDNTPVLFKYSGNNIAMPIIFAEGSFTEIESIGDKSGDTQIKKTGRR